MSAVIQPSSSRSTPANSTAPVFIWQPITILIVSLIVLGYAAITQTPAALLLTGATIWIGGLLQAYFWSSNKRHFRLAHFLQWIHSVSACLLLTLMSPDLIGISLLIILDGLLEVMLSPLATRRSLKQAVVVATALTAAIINIVILTYFDIFFIPQLFSSFEISLVNTLLIAPYTIDILQRVWRFQLQISTTVTTLQQTNHQLEATQSQLQQRLNERAQLLEISRAVSSTMDLSSLLLHMITQLHSVIPYGRATMNLARNNELVEILNIGDIPDVPNTVAGAGRQQDHVQSLMQLTEPLVIDDVSQFIPYMPGAFLAVPFLMRGSCIGVLTLRHAQIGFYTQQKGDLCMAFANQVAGMINAAQLKEASTSAMIIAERHRLARELHDSVSQLLFGIVLGTRTALEQLHNAPAAARTALEYSIHLASTALAEMRALIFTLRPETLQRKGLISALQSQIDLLQSNHNLKITLAAPHGEPNLSLRHKEYLYRIAAEAIQNAIRHSRCSTIELLIETRPYLRLEITDDGCGFDPTADFGERLGLLSMHEHAAALGGVLIVDSAPSQGTRIYAITHPANQSGTKP